MTNVVQRQLLIRRVLELDDPPLGDADERLVESRLAALRDAPASALSPEETQGPPSLALLDSTLVMVILPL
jgi:hypothetical protein